MLELDRSLVNEIGFNPYYNIHDSMQMQYIDLASNNYLGLATDERLKAAVILATEKYGTSMCGKPIATGYISLYKQVEHKLADLVGLDEAIIFPSCYQANNGIFATLANKDDLIIVDRYIHSSLVQGIKAVGCRINPFMHNDMNHLEKILFRSHNYRQIFVVTESVFSTEGSIAPVHNMIALCEKYNAIAVIDDSHGIGVLGDKGSGILEYFNIKDFQGIYTASLGKALANSGGMVGGNKKIIEYLRYYCPQLIYSTAITPPTLGGISGALDIIQTDFNELRIKIWAYKELIVESIKNIQKSQAPINTISTGSARDTLMLSKRLFDQGILSTPFIEPSVPKNSGVVRLIAGAGLSQLQVDQAIEKIKVCL